MNVFDFDGTIYNGDSTIDFWIFCLRRIPSLFCYFPRQFLGAILYQFKKITKEEFKSRYFSFLAGIPDIDFFVKEFWNKNERKIKSWYKEKQKNDDCIISASPDFLLLEICNRLGIKNLIATKVDKKTGILIGKNCHDKNKPVFFREKFNEVEIDEFFSDSKSDEPMAKLAKKAILVKKNKLFPFNNKSIFFLKVTKIYLILYSILMLIYCSFWNPVPIEEWDDYMMPTVTLISKNPHLAIFEADIQKAKNVYPDWKDYIDNMKFSSLTAKNGGELPWYFPTYSIMCIPLRLILPILKIPTIYAFSFTNLFLFLLMSFYAFFIIQKTNDSLKCLIFIILLTFNPIVFYFEWISAEVFIYTLLSFSMLQCIQKKWSKAVLFSSFAATLNPTIIVIVFGLLLLEFLYKKCFSLQSILFLVISFLPFMYNFYNTGHINLSVGAGFGDYDFFPRFISYIFDLNYGFLPYFAPILIFTFILIPIGFYKKDCIFIYFTTLFFLTIIAYSFMNHINCGMSGIARYNIWNYVILLFAVYQSKVFDKFFTVIGSLNFIISVLIIICYNPILSKDSDDLHFTPIASFVLDNYPSIYNPLHSTFYSRTAHVYGGYDYSCPIIYTDKKGKVRKILVTLNEKDILMTELAAEDEKSKLFINKIIKNLEQGEKYISVPKKYKLLLIQLEDKYD